MPFYNNAYYPRRRRRRRCRHPLIVVFFRVLGSLECLVRSIIGRFVPSFASRRPGNDCEAIWTAAARRGFFLFECLFDDLITTLQAAVRRDGWCFQYQWHFSTHRLARIRWFVLSGCVVMDFVEGGWYLRHKPKKTWCSSRHRFPAGPVLLHRQFRNGVYHPRNVNKRWCKHACRQLPPAAPHRRHLRFPWPRASKCKRFRSPESFWNPRGTLFALFALLASSWRRRCHAGVTSIHGCRLFAASASLHCVGLDASQPPHQMMPPRIRRVATTMHIPAPESITLPPMPRVVHFCRLWHYGWGSVQRNLRVTSGVMQDRRSAYRNSVLQQNSLL